MIVIRRASFFSVTLTFALLIRPLNFTTGLAFCDLSPQSTEVVLGTFPRRRSVPVEDSPKVLLGSEVIVMKKPNNPKHIFMHSIVGFELVILVNFSSLRL